MDSGEKKKLTDAETKLIDAIVKGKIEEVQALLKEPDIKVDFLDDSGTTPLQHAAFRGRTDICQLLLNNGADVNSRFHDNGYSALMFAALSGNAQTTKLLLEAGAKTDYVNSVGRTATQMAAFVGQHECVSVINNYFAKEDLSVYTKVQGVDTEPRLPQELTHPLALMINFANLHPVKSSIHDSRTSDYAVDGDKTGLYYFCTHTTDLVPSILEWWAVDLGRLHTVTSINIFGRTECCQDRLRYFDIEVIHMEFYSDSKWSQLNSGRRSLCHHRGDQDTTNLEVTCPINMVGNFVRIKHTQELILTLCEVEVYGWPVQPFRAGRSLATGKPAKSKSSYTGGKPENAVDGSSKLDWYEFSCFHSAESPTDKEWWAVSLGDVFTITHVVMLGRSGCCSHRMGDIDIEIILLTSGDDWALEQGTVSRCYYQKDPTAYIGVTCPENQAGNYVRIIHRETEVLSFCEVYVFGFKAADRILQLQGRNVALGKQTAASSLWMTDGSYDSSMAVDGRYGFVATDPWNCFCSLSENINNEWWVVDLELKYQIDIVVVYGRDDNYDTSLQSFDIDVIDHNCCKPGDFASIENGQVTPCYYQQSRTVFLIAYCDQSPIGQFVRFRVKGQFTICLCEVEVYGRQVAPFDYGKKDNFQCDDLTCIPQESRCDGAVDCPDAEDEMNCPCFEDQFKCNNSSMCIDTFRKCNGIKDCLTGEDEENCHECGVNYKCNDGTCVSRNSICKENNPCNNETINIKCCYECFDGPCIKFYKICDGIKDCKTGEDEQFCSRGCGMGMRSCRKDSNSICIPFFKLCDMEQDCPLAEDELSCNTSFVLQTTTEDFTTTEMQTTTTETEITTTEMDTTTTEVKTTTGTDTTVAIKSTTTTMKSSMLACIMQSSAPTTTTANVMNLLLAMILVLEFVLQLIIR